MASITGKNLQVLVAAKRLAVQSQRQSILKDPKLINKCAERITHKVKEIEDYKEQEARLAKQLGEMRRAYFINEGVIREKV